MDCVCDVRNEDCKSAHTLTHIARDACSHILTIAHTICTTPERQGGQAHGDWDDRDAAKCALRSLRRHPAGPAVCLLLSVPHTLPNCLPLSRIPNRTHARTHARARTHTHTHIHTHTHTL